MNLVHTSGDFPLNLNLVRGSGSPSESCSVLLSTAGSSLASSITLSSFGLLEYSIDGGSTWGNVTFPALPINNVILSIRAKATNQTSLPASSVVIADASIPVNFSISTPASTSVSYSASTQTADRAAAGFFQTFSNILVTLRNYDLQAVSVSKPIVVSASGNNLISSTSSPIPSASVSITSVTGVTQTETFTVHVPRDQEPFQAYYWDLNFTFDGVTTKLASDCLKLNGVKFEDVGGKQPRLLGVCKRTCSPTSIRVIAKKSLATQSWTATAPTGFKVSLSNNGTGLANSVSVASSDLVDDRFVYVYLDSTSIGSAPDRILTGNLQLSSGSLASIRQIPLEGKNDPAFVTPVFRTKNIVVSAAPNPKNGFSLYHEETDGTNSVLSGAEVTYSYTSQPYYLSEGVVTVDPIDLTTAVWGSSIPTTPGQHAVRAQWSDFQSGGITFAGGEAIAYYLLLPQASDPTFYGVTQYIEFERIPSFPFGLSLTPQAPIAKNLFGASVSGVTCGVYYSGTMADGVAYSSATFPSYPGNYTVTPFYSSGSPLFYLSGTEEAVVPHGLSNDFLIPQGSLTFADDETAYPASTIPSPFQQIPQPDIDGVPQASVFIPLRVEVISDKFFKLYQNGVTPKNYFDFNGLLSFNLDVPNTNIFGVITGSSQMLDTFVESSGLSASTSSLVIRARPVYVSACLDNVFPSNLIDTSSVQFQGVLASDASSLNSAKVFSSQNYYDSETQEEYFLPNDLNPSLFYDIKLTFSFPTASPSLLGKYSFPPNFTSSSCQLFRKRLYYIRPSGDATKTYDKQGYYDYPSALTLKAGSTLEEVGDVVAFLSLTSFSGVRTAGTIPAFPEIITSGARNSLYLSLLDDYRISANLVVTPILLTFPATTTSNRTKVYDGLPNISGVSFAVQGALSGDDVFVSQVNLPSANVGSYSATSVVLGGLDRANYVFGSISSGWNSTATIVVSPKPLTISLAASRAYEGSSETRIPLVTAIVSGFRLPNEPLSIVPLAPSFDSGNAGTRTSSSTRSVAGGLASNYTISFQGGNTLSGAITGTITPVPLTLKPALSFALSLVPGGIVYSDSRNVAQFLSNSLNANTLEGSQNSELTLSDLSFSATLNNANRGTRTLSFAFLGLLPTSSYFGNYAVTPVTRSIQVTVNPKDVTDSETAFLITGFSGATSNTITSTSHGIAEGGDVYFRELAYESSSPSFGVAKNIRYYAKNVTANTLQVSTTPNGTAIAFTPVKKISVTGSTRTLPTGTALSLNETFTSTSHGMKVGDVVRFSSVTPSTGTGITLNTSYYVLTVPSANNFTLGTSTSPTSTLNITLSVTGWTAVVQDQLTLADHGLAVGDKIVFDSITPSSGTGLSTNTIYYVRNVPSTSTFSIGASLEASTNVPITASLTSSILISPPMNGVLSGSNVSSFGLAGFVLDGVKGSSTPFITFKNAAPTVSFSPTELVDPVGPPSTSISYYQLTTDNANNTVFTLKNLSEITTAGNYQARITFPNADDVNSTSNYRASSYLPVNFSIQKSTVNVTSVMVDPVVYGAGFWPFADIVVPPAAISGLVAGHNAGLSVTGEYQGNPDLFVPTSTITLVWSLVDTLNYQLSPSILTSTTGVVSAKTLTYGNTENTSTTSKVYDGTASASQVRWGSSLATQPTINGLLDDGRVLSVVFTEAGNSYGSGYTSAPSVSFTGGGGSGATATATVFGGSINNVEITNPGFGYTSAPTVVFTGGGGSGANGTATVAKLVTYTATTTYSSPSASASAQLVTNVSLLGGGLVGGGRAGNYVIPQRISIGTITKKSISFSGIKSGSKMFDGTPEAPLFTDGFSYTGLVATDSSLSNVLTGSIRAAYTDFNAGSNKTVNLFGIQPPSPNYQFSSSEPFIISPSVGFEHTVTQRPLSIKPKAVFRYFGDNWPTGGINTCPGTLCGLKYSEKNARPLVSGGSILNIFVLSGGSGFPSNPTVTISAPNYTSGIQATASAVVAGGVVVAIVLTNAGTGYRVSPQITVSGGSNLVLSSVVSPIAITQGSSFDIAGLVSSNQNNPIDPITGTFSGDEIESSSLVILDEFTDKNKSATLWANATYTLANDVIFSRGLKSNYQITTGETSTPEGLAQRGLVVILKSSLKDSTKTIQEALWAQKCKTFGCQELPWFDLIEAGNRDLVTVDFVNLNEDGKLIYLEDAQQVDPNDPEYLATEG